MKNFASLRIATLVLVAGYMLKTTSADADVTFLGVAAGDATTNDVIVWTRAKDEANPQPTTINVQISQDPTFITGVTTLPAGTAGSPTDYTVKSNVGGLEPGTVYYYRFQTTNASVTSNVGKFKTAPTPTANAPVHFGFSGDCDGLIRPYALASQVPAKNLDFFMFDGDTEYETSASIGSPAVHSTGNIPDPTVTVPTATESQLFDDFSRKYREQFVPVNIGGQSCLQPFFAGQGNYTAYDNHELGNKQYINGGAPAGGGVGSTTGGPPFDFSTGAGVDARNSVNDVTPNDGSVPFLNKSGGLQTLQQVFENYQPMKERGLINAPLDPRTNGTRQLYFAQQWSRNAIFINTDCRSYRDIRMKTAANADETGSRADNPNRTMLGATQLAWLEQTLLDAEHTGTTWKFINISDPIDQIGPIGGSLTLVNPPTTADYGTLGSISSIVTTGSTNNTRTVTVASTVGLVAGQGVFGAGVPANTTINAINTDGTTFSINNNATIASGATLTLTPAPSTYAPVSSDGGKSWMGGYRAERNELLKFIADHRIHNVVFLATDDHQNRINELFYSPTGQTGVQASYIKAPYCFEIVCGPLGATGPDLISNHSFALVKKLADSIANAQIAENLEPIGLAGYHGLQDVRRSGDPHADRLRQPADFYSPDTFNYNVLDVSADGKTLTVTSYGINSTVQNGFVEYDPVNNPERELFSSRSKGIPDR
ncbi:MAG TPA: alkaline phosphatase D family protein [Candidatus Udaeobacter sp.]|nr:alkaline phosphatase D family protein [Candidatus Udaeobacter sp.]